MENNKAGRPEAVDDIIEPTHTNLSKEGGTDENMDDQAKQKAMLPSGRLLTKGDGEVPELNEVMPTDHVVQDKSPANDPIRIDSDEPNTDLQVVTGVDTLGDAEKKAKLLSKCALAESDDDVISRVDSC